jgi:hypothetical protein
MIRCMAKLLLNLRHVPDDEASEVRELLDGHGIAYYETRPSRWGVSAGGIWLRENRDADRAGQLMAEYQRTRQARAREAFAAARRAGEVPTLMELARQQPLRVIGLIAAIALILAVSAIPFVMLLR